MHSGEVIVGWERGVSPLGLAMVYSRAGFVARGDTVGKCFYARMCGTQPTPGLGAPIG